MNTTSGFNQGGDSRQGSAGTKLPFRRLLAFSTLSCPVTAANLPVAVYLPAIYAQNFHVPLATIGLIFLLERLWGTVADPLVGVLSDRTNSRHGKRKTWIAAGGVLFGTSTIFLFFPSRDVGGLTLAISLFFFYLSWAMLQIPYLAWSGELTDDRHERTRIAFFQMVAGAIAMFVVLLVPTLADSFWPADAEKKLAAMGWALLVPLIPAMALTLYAFPDSSAVREPAKHTVRFSEALRLILGEPGLLKIILADFAMTMGQGLRGALFIFFVSYCVGAPHWASALFLVQFVFGIAAAPIWSAIAGRFGKLRAAMWAEAGQVVVNLALLGVGQGQIAALVVLTVAQGLLQSSGNLILRSMLADVADAHRRSTGVNRTGLIFSGFSASAKVGMAAAIGIALPLVAWFGFDPARSTNRPEALTAVALVFAAGPALAHLCAALFIRRLSDTKVPEAETPGLPVLEDGGPA